MARPPRPLLPDGLYRRLFLELLAKGVGRYHWRILSYCLMTNHYHLLVQTPLSEPLARDAPAERRLCAVLQPTSRPGRTSLPGPLSGVGRAGGRPSSLGRALHPQKPRPRWPLSRSGRVALVESPRGARREPRWLLDRVQLLAHFGEPRSSGRERYRRTSNTGLAGSFAAAISVYVTGCATSFGVWVGADTPPDCSIVMATTAPGLIDTDRGTIVSAPANTAAEEGALAFGLMTHAW